MIDDLPNASSRDVAKRLVRLRHDMGAVTLGRVLTLVVDVDESRADAAVEAASDATRQAPSRIIAVVRGNRRGASRLDAQIRIGGDAGASEIIVLRLYGKLAEHGRSVIIPLLLPDSPIVVWWPGEAPDDLAASPIGSMAQRRVTDAEQSRTPKRALERRGKFYHPGDTDLAWTRLTRWRGLLAASLDQRPFEQVTAVTVTGAADSPSTDLLAGWLAVRLRCPVVRARSRAGTGVVSVRLERAAGPIDLVRTSPTQATLTQPGQPVRRITLVEPLLAPALAEELRRLDADETYEEALTKGQQLVGAKGPTASEAVSADEAPDVEDAKRAGEAARRRGSSAASGAMRDAEPEAGASTGTVHRAATKKLERKQAERGAAPGTPGSAPATTKAAANKTVAKKPSAAASAQKSGAKKPSAAKAAPAKSAPTKAVAKKATSPKKAVAKKAPVKKAPAKKSS